MALGGGHAARRSAARQLDHGAALSALEETVPGRRRRVPGSDSESDLELQKSGRADGRRTGARSQRLRDHRRGRQSDAESDGRCRQAAAEFQPGPGRWFDRVRLLDLFRQLQRVGQSDGASRQQRSQQDGRLFQLDVRVAAQPAHLVQPCVCRLARQSLGSDPQDHRVGRQQMGGIGRNRISVRPRRRIRSVRSS